MIPIRFPEQWETARGYYSLHSEIPDWGLPTQGDSKLKGRLSAYKTPKLLTHCTTHSLVVSLLNFTNISVTRVLFFLYEWHDVKENSPRKNNWCLADTYETASTVTGRASYVRIYPILRPDPPQIWNIYPLDQGKVISCLEAHLSLISFSF